MTANKDLNEQKAHTALILSDFGLKNYGNRLQSFAVLSILQAYGVNGVIAAQFDDTATWLIKDIIKRVIPTRFWHKKHRYNRFRNFAKIYTPYKIIKLKRLYDVAAHFDCVVVGSDQVWSPTYIARWSNPTMFFLVEMPASKKIALSPSIGLTSIPADMEQVYLDGLRSFSRVSVREDAGARIIEQVSGMKAEVLADPTVGVKAKIWRDIADYSFCPDADYILTYYLGNGLESLTAKISEYAEAHSLKIVNLMDKNERYFDSGPAEFIGLIDRAHYVITDSFHGSVFAMLLHTPFNVIRRTDAIGSKMFSRIETLTNKFGCRNRIIDGEDCMLNVDNINWEAIDECVASEREKILNYMAEELVRCGLA